MRNAEKAKLQKHSESLLAAVARVTAGGGGEAPGPLGPVSLPENASKGAKAIIAQQAAACKELEVARRRGSTPASSSSQPVSVPWLSTQERARVSKFTEWFGFSPHTSSSEAVVCVASARALTLQLMVTTLLCRRWLNGRGRFFEFQAGRRRRGQMCSEPLCGRERRSHEIAR